MNSRRIAVQSASRLLRECLASWLAGQPGWTVVGATSGWADLPRLCALRHPDLVVFEVAGAEAKTLVSRVRGRATSPQLVGLYRDLDAPSLLELHRAGVDRLVCEQAGLAAFEDALRALPPHAGPVRAHHGLTDRELEVLALVWAGCSVAQIGEALVISPHSVENHKRRIFAKLGVHSRIQAAAEASRLGLFPPPGRSVSAAELTRREGDILRSIAAGDSVRQTARTLGIAVKTVQSEQRQLFAKLAVHNRLEALTAARSLGLVTHD
jgi:DNA-binding NarL/FixJ family response regulator